MNTGSKKAGDFSLGMKQRLGIAILISNHILSELDQIATCYGFINRGRMLVQVTSKELLEKCKHYLLICTENVQNTAAVLMEMYLKDYIWLA